MAESETAKHYYTVAVVGVKPANFEDAMAARSSPSFNVTMCIDNRYDRDLYIDDWSFSLWLDGVPLGRGSFPYDLTASSMSETTVTGTTLSALVWGGEQEVRSHQIANGKSMEDLELQVDMRFGIYGPDDGVDAYAWYWCSARIGDHSAPSLCQRLRG
jgi:hypothetical protein